MIYSSTLISITVQASRQLLKLETRRLALISPLQTFPYLTCFHSLLFWPWTSFPYIFLSSARALILSWGFPTSKLWATCYLCGGCPVHHKMLSKFPGFYPLDVSSTLLPKSSNPKFLMLPNVLWITKSPWLETYHIHPSHPDFPSVFIIIILTFSIHWHSICLFLLILST